MKGAVWGLVLLLLISGASASYISIQSSITKTLRPGAADITVEVINKGDEAAYNVQLEIVAAGMEKISPMQPLLGINQPFTWQTSIDTGSLNPGSYPLILTVVYHDANLYPFSAISSAIIGESTTSQASGSVENIAIAKSGSITVNLLSPSKRDLKVTIFTPKEIQTSEKQKIVSVDGASSVSFPIIKNTALAGSTYTSTAVIEYDEAGRHYTSFATGTIQILAQENRIKQLFSFPKRLMWIFAGIIIALIVWFQFLKLKPVKKGWIEALFLAAILIYLMSLFSPGLIFSKTTTTGGDMGSHIVLAEYMKDYLLPHFKLHGWYPHWFGGFPINQFYFIPPYLLAALLSYIIPFEISFKIVTILGTLLLPICVYFGTRFLDFKKEGSIIASIFSLVFLTLNHYSTWGGNIKSTLAGEFSYSLSFALLFLAMGLFYKGMKTKKYLIANAIVISLMVLCHVYTAFIFALAALFMLLDDIRNVEKIKYLLKAALLTILLTGFWIVPLLAKFAWNMAPKDVFYGSPMLDTFFIKGLFPFYIAAFLAVLWIKRDNVRLLFYSFAAVLGFTFVCKYINLLYIRFLPFLYMIILLLGAYAISEAMGRLKAKSLFLLLVLILTIGYLNTGEIESWIKWNYEGLENKAPYDSLRQLSDYFEAKDISGRIDFEYYNYNYLGTPRVFEAFPYLTGKSVMEGLNLESSLTFPFFFYLQKEVSEDAWWPGFDIRIPEFNLAQGIKDLSLYNVKYYIARSDKAKASATQLNLTLEKQIENFNIYRVNENSRYVEALEYEPLLIVAKDFRKYAFDWMEQPDKKVFWAFGQPDARFSQVMSEPSEEDLKKAIASPTNAVDCDITEAFDNERISFTTKCIGKPHLIKISYFPNWKVKGADRIYLVSPDLMLVYPNTKKVELYYGATFGDILGFIFTLTGLCLVIFIVFFREKIEKMRKKIRWIVHMNKLCSKWYAKFLKKKRLILYVILAVIIILLVILFSLRYFNVRSACKNYCTENGFASGSGIIGLKEVDHLPLGFRHQAEESEHSFVCNLAYCDESRKDFVYVHQGSIEFDIKAAPGETILTIKAMGGNMCRENIVIINGLNYTMYEDGRQGMKREFSFTIPKQESGSIHVKIIHPDATSCAGFDVYDIYSYDNRCRCSV